MGYLVTIANEPTVLPSETATTFPGKLIELTLSRIPGEHNIRHKPVAA